jgi:hypothetical protein
MSGIGTLIHHNLDRLAVGMDDFPMKSILVLAYRIVVMAEEESHVRETIKSPLPIHDASSLSRHISYRYYVTLIVGAESH